MSTTLKRLILPLALLVVGLPVGIGAVMAMGDDEEPPAEASESFMPISQGSVPRDQRHSQARWETVRTLKGDGDAEESFSIVEAIQWQANWKCRSGRLRMSVDPDSGEDNTLADTDCPDVGSERSTGDGGGKLRVSASGPWQVRIRQQVDTALEEPPLPGMTPANRLARGRFHPIQKKGEGMVALYRLDDGRLALRYEDFYTSPSPGLELWLSEADDPRSTLDARRADYQNAGTPRSTYGSYNQVLPRDVDPEKIDSIVIWCPAVTIAFSAASLS